MQPYVNTIWLKIHYRSASDKIKKWYKVIQDRWSIDFLCNFPSLVTGIDITMSVTSHFWIIYVCCLSSMPVFSFRISTYLSFIFMFAYCCMVKTNKEPTAIGPAEPKWMVDYMQVRVKLQHFVRTFFCMFLYFLGALSCIYANHLFTIYSFCYNIHDYMNGAC